MDIQITKDFDNLSEESKAICPILSLLAPDWELYTRRDVPCIVHKQVGAIVSFGYTSRDRKYHAHCHWPMDGNRWCSGSDWSVLPYGENISASFTLSRPAHVIAKDIKRRVIDKYVHLYALALDKRAERDRKRDHLSAVHQSLLEDFRGTDYSSGNDKDRKVGRGFYNDDSIKIGVEWETYDGDDFRLELRHLSKDQVRNILVLIKDQVL